MGIFDPRQSTDFFKLKNAIDFELIRKERKIEQAMRLKFAWIIGFNDLFINCFCFYFLIYF